MKLRQRAEDLIEKEKWDEALLLSRKLCEEVPDSMLGYINVSICLHNLGKTAEAKIFLQGGPVFLQNSPVYFYNLACYEAQLANFKKAEELLNVSFEMDGRYRETAKADPDLAVLFHTPSGFNLRG